MNGIANSVREDMEISFKTISHIDQVIGAITGGRDVQKTNMEPHADSLTGNLDVLHENLLKILEGTMMIRDLIIGNAPTPVASDGRGDRW